MKSKYPIIIAVCAFLLNAMLPGAHANDWTAGIGYWDNAANWNGGVPNNAVGNVSNGGTAIVSNTVPNCSEVWAGNGGVVGTVIVTNGGVLPVNGWLVMARMYQSGSPTPFSTVTIDGGTVNKSGSGLIVGDSYGGMFSEGKLTVTGNGILNVTGGWFGIGNGDGSKGTVVFKGNAVLNGSGNDFNVADYGASKGFCYVQDNATLNVSRFWVGKTDTSMGALWQTGGAVVGTGANANEWTIGGDNSSSTGVFGFYSLAGGTLNCPFNFQNGRYGKGIIYQSGGTNTQGSWCDNGRYPGSIGVTWLTGGLLQHISTAQRYFVAEQGRGEVTISGLGVLDTAANIIFGDTGTAVANLNLNGGTLRVPGIGKNNGVGYLNFNGGTLQAKISNPAFLNNILTEATVYSGNAVVDTAGNDITITQPLVAPSGSGVLSVPVSNGGAGYMEPPMVQIDASGAGSGAMAVAQINPVAGTVTNIVVTCPGYNYGGPPNVTLLGGGASTAATLGTAVIGAVTSGGLTKNGNGILTLTGANTYTGATVVNAGAVILTPNATGNGAVSVANSATFGVTLPYANGQLFPSSVTLGTSSGTTLAFDLGGFGNPGSAPLSVVGNLAVNGTVSLIIADALPQLGPIPLVQYGLRSGSGSFVLGSLPAGVQANLVDDTVNKLVYLNVTSIGLPRWEGLAGATWDVNVTTNWIELSTGLPTFFKNGSPALFDDSALGSTTVNLVATVLPVSVNVNATNLNYIFTGVGKISGTTGLTKTGTGTLTIQGALNDYTGSTAIKGGTVAVTNLANGNVASAIGKSTSVSTNLVLANGTLSYSGPAIKIDRGYSVQDTNSVIDAESSLNLGGNVSATTGSSFRKTGPALLTYSGTGANELSGGGFPGYNAAAGTVVFDGSAGAQTNHSQSELWVGGTPASGANMILSNTTIKVDSWISVARGTGTGGYTSTLTTYNSSLTCVGFSMGFDAAIAGNNEFAIMNMNNSTFRDNGDVNIGESSGATGTFNLNGTSVFSTPNRLLIGLNTGATGTVVMADSSIITNGAWLSCGANGYGTLIMKNNSLFVEPSDFNFGDYGAVGTVGNFLIQDNAKVLLTGGSVFVGKSASAIGNVTQTGGTVDARVAGVFQLGQATGTSGTWLQSGGTTYAGGWFSIGRGGDTSSTGLYVISGGLLDQTGTGNGLIVGEQGTGTLTITNTATVISEANNSGIGVAIGWNAGIGILNLDGGSLTANYIQGGANGNSTFNFNGGLLKAGAAARLNFMTNLTSAIVLSGAKIDTGTNTIAINQALQDGGLGGGLTKTGNGTLLLNSVNTYAGTTTVSAGTLGGYGTIAGPVVVSAGGTLSPGASIGTLTLGSSLNLAGTTVMEVNKTAGTSDLVTGASTIHFGGTLVLKNLSGALAVNDTFTLFSAGSYTGSFSGGSVISQTPNQTVTWDVSQLAPGGNGTVKVLTAVTTPAKIASVVSGGKLNLSWPANQTGWQLQHQVNPLTVGISTNWSAVAGSTATNQVTLPVDITEPTEFFRLVFPAQ